MAKNVKNYPRVNLNLKYSVIEEYKEALENAMKKIDVQLPFKVWEKEKKIKILNNLRFKLFNWKENFTLGLNLLKIPQKNF